MKLALRSVIWHAVVAWNCKIREVLPSTHTFSANVIKMFTNVAYYLYFHEVGSLFNSPRSWTNSISYIVLCGYWKNIISCCVVLYISTTSEVMSRTVHTTLLTYNRWGTLITQGINTLRLPPRYQSIWAIYIPLESLWLIDFRNASFNLNFWRFIMPCSAT